MVNMAVGENKGGDRRGIKSRVLNVLVQNSSLMAAIDEYSGSPITRCALQFMARVFLRSKEVRFAEWSEIDFERQEWRIPLAKMKGKKRDKEASPSAFHLVPLATQTVAILQEVQAFTGEGKYVFPGLRGSKPITT